MAAPRPDVAGSAGVLSIALALAGQACEPIWRFPSTGASGMQIATFFTAHRDAVQAEQVLNAAAVMLWFVFACGLWLRLRAERGAPAMASACVVGGFAALTTLLLAGFTCANVLTYRTQAPAEARLLYDLTFGLLAMSGLPTAVALTAFAAAVYRSGGLPARLAHLASATALAHVLLLASFVAPSGFLSLEGSMIVWVPALLFLWIGETALFMTLRPQRGAPPVPAPHPASVR